MSDIGGIVFIIGLLAFIPVTGKMAHTFIKEKDINPAELILVFVFVMMMLIGINN